MSINHTKQHLQLRERLKGTSNLICITRCLLLDSKDDKDGGSLSSGASNKVILFNSLTNHQRHVKNLMTEILLHYTERGDDATPFASVTLS
jgi:hypothetical protein